MRAPSGSPNARWDRTRRARRFGPEGWVAQPKGFHGVRLTDAEAGSALGLAADRLAIPRSGWLGEDFNILAISGGAAGGAFGAGALVGLGQTGRRPEFALVTGVSTGALIAPFAFLGSAWDDRLTDAYTGGHAAERFGMASISPLLDGALFRPEALERLVQPFVDAELLSAVAEQHRRGRRLLVATTDLDTQRPAIWDMGEVASRGGDAAVTMFREILVASASLPGLFRPRLIACEADGDEFDELHVDGGVSAPLFLMPDALLRWRSLGRRLRRGKVYVIINTVIDPSPRTTAPHLPAVLIRSFDTMLRVSYRQALNVAATFCAAHNIPLNIAAIPDSPAATENGAMLSFDTPSMRATFEAGRAAALEGRLWRVPAKGREPWGAFLELIGVAEG
jgi:hypothetical protein